MPEVAERFYMIFVEGQRPPTYQHGNLQNAVEEASRLARIPENIGRKVFILETIQCLRSNPLPVDNIKIESPLVPF
jgi:hypothetical protein